MEKTILFVDDEPMILKVLEGLFLNHGFSPRCASSGREALEIVTRETIRVCFVDLKMPLMDGLELCWRLKQRDPGICVYALSAYIDEFSPDQYRKAEFDGCFHKPFKIDALLNAGREAFEKVEEADRQCGKT